MNAPSLAVFAALIVCGCSNSADSSRISVLEARVNSLETRLTTSDEQIRFLNDANDKQATQLVNLKFDTGVNWVDFDPADTDGYMNVRTKIGTLLLSIDRVEPIADGSKVILRVGNPTSATLLGLELQTRYGSRWDQKADYNQWQSGLAAKEVSIADTLFPSSWNYVSFALPGVKPDQLGHISLAARTDRISLR